MEPGHAKKRLPSRIGADDDAIHVADNQQRRILKRALAEQELVLGI